MGRVLLAVYCAVLCSGCMSFDLGDSKSEADDYVEETLTYTQQRKATDYFASGGAYWDDGTNESKNVDRDVLLPLCQRLESEFKVEPVVLVATDEGQSYGEMLVMKAPGDAAVRSSVDAAVEEADAKFDGAIWVDWGNRWASIEVEESEDIE